MWIKKEQLLFLPNMSAAHFNPDSTFVFEKILLTMPRTKKEQRKWTGKEPTQLANGIRKHLPEIAKEIKL